MKKLFLPLTLAAAIACIATSCSKKDNNTTSTGSTTRTYLLGTWKTIKVASDDNGNGVMDADEVINTDTANYATDIFNSDGTGTNNVVTAGVPFSYSFTWSLQSGDTYLQITPSGGAGVSATHIDNISATSLTLKDTITDFVGWTVLAKQ